MLETTPLPAREAAAHPHSPGAAACWICGSTEVVGWKPPTIQRPLTADDLRITDARYGATLALRRCQRCAFIFAADDQLERLPALYERLTDAGYFESGEARRLQMRWLLEHVLRVCPGARTLLDVGAATGLLVAEAQRAGIAAVGVEPSHALVANARAANGVDLVQGLFPHPRLHGRRFDVICVIDVIEHVTNPVALLRDCADALTPGGVVVVVTPDVGSVAARVMGRRWWHFRLAHVGYFNRTSLRRAAAAAGLAPIDLFTARWFFRVRYIAERLTRYVPIQRVNRMADRLSLLRRVYERVIPLDFHDSIGVVLRRTDDSRPGLAGADVHTA